MTRNRKLLLVYLISLTLFLIWLCNYQFALGYEHSAEALKHLDKAKQYVIQGKYDQAKTELFAGLKYNPKSPDILNNLGSIYLRLSQNARDANVRTSSLDTARVYFTTALDADPDFPAAWNGLADVYYLNGQTHQAISYYKKALSLSPKNAYESQTNLANALRDAELNQEATDNYKKAIELNPLYAPAHNGYAELLFAQHNLEQAYYETAEAIRLKPTYATAYYHLGLIENARGNKTDALKAYLLSLRYEKNSKYAQDTQHLIDKLGLDTNSISFQDLQDFQSKLVKSMVSFTPAQPELSNNKTQSITKEIQPVSSTPKEQQVNFATISSLITNKQWKQANSTIVSLLKEHPNDPVLLNELGLVLFNQKKYIEAEKVLNQALLESDNSLASAYYNLGQVYLAKHNLSKAQSSFEKAKSFSDHPKVDSALINNALAITFKQEGDLKAAQSAYEEAIKQGGDNYPVIHYNLGILLEKMDKSQQAIQEFQSYLRLAPQGLNVKNAQLHLKELL